MIRSGCVFAIKTRSLSAHTVSWAVYVLGRRGRMFHPLSKKIYSLISSTSLLLPFDFRQKKKGREGGRKKESEQRVGREIRPRQANPEESISAGPPSSHPRAGTTPSPSPLRSPHSHPADSGAASRPPVDSARSSLVPGRVLLVSPPGSLIEPALGVPAGAAQCGGLGGRWADQSAPGSSPAQGSVAGVGPVPVADYCVIRARTSAARR